MLPVFGPAPHALARDIDDPRVRALENSCGRKWLPHEWQSDGSFFGMENVVTRMRCALEFYPNEQQLLTAEELEYAAFWRSAYTSGWKWKRFIEPRLEHWALLCAMGPHAFPYFELFDELTARVAPDEAPR